MLGATWLGITEVDGQPVRTMPGRRMQAGRTYRVPFTPEMLALLGERRAGDAFLFWRSALISICRYGPPVSANLFLQ
jgi:hypothetical protein